MARTSMAKKRTKMTQNNPRKPQTSSSSKASPKYIKPDKIPSSLNPRCSLEMFSNLSYGDSSLDPLKNKNIPDIPFLRAGDIVDIQYSGRTIYENVSPEENFLLVNPIIVCCGFNSGVMHGIDLRLLNILSQGRDISNKFYSDYKKKFYPQGDGIKKYMDDYDRNNFTASSLNSGQYGSEDILRFHRSYKITNFRSNPVIIINIEQAESRSKSGQITAPNSK